VNAAELLKRYSPYVQYDSLESYAADSVAVMTDCIPAEFPARLHALPARRQGAGRRWKPRRRGKAKLDVGDSCAPAHYAGPPASTEVSDRDYIDAVGSGTSKTPARCTPVPATPTQVDGADPPRQGRRPLAQ
jgi:hypothetical protein